MIELLGFEVDPTLLAVLVAALGLASLILIGGIVAIARRGAPAADEREAPGHHRHRSAVADEDPILAAMGLERGPTDPGAPAPGDRSRGARA